VATGAISSAALMQSGEVYTWVRTAAVFLTRGRLATTHSLDPDRLCYSHSRLAIQGGNTDHQLGQGDDRNQATLRYLLLCLLTRAQTFAEHLY
jgi:hypothetical protein